MTAFSLRARLHFGANSDLALSLPQSRLCILRARQLCPLAVLRSCFGYSLSHLRTAAACLSRCIRHRRRSKAKPLRGRRGRFRAIHRVASVRTVALRFPHHRRGARRRHRQISFNNKVTILYLKTYRFLCIITLNNGEMCFAEAE